MDISFENVDYIYQPNSPFQFQALKNLSFEINSGEFVAIVGHTGSGKSTVIQHLNGLLRPTHGKTKIGDFTLTSDHKPKDMKSLREQVGIVFQYPEHQLFEETVEKDISFGPANFGVATEQIKERVKASIEAVGISTDLLNRSPFELSGGQMRRVAIAGVLAVEPKVLVLDEPTAGLDPKGRKEIMNMFYRLHKEKGLTTILVTHHMEDALKFSDKVIVLEKGTKYLEGSVQEVFSNQDRLNKVQLDIPEILTVVKEINNRFGLSIDYQGQSLDELAEQVSVGLKGLKKHE